MTGFIFRVSFVLCCTLVVLILTMRVIGDIMRSPVLTFVSSSDATRAQIFLLDTTHGLVTRLSSADGEPHYYPTWSIGGKLAFTSTNLAGEIYVFDFRTDSLINITSNLDNNVAYNPAWSPDGLQLAFVSFHSFQRYSISILNVESRILTPVTLTEEDIAGGLSWSPDGTHLAYSVNPQNVQVRVIHIASGELVFSADASPSQPYYSWSPDGRYLALAISDIYLLDVLSGETTSITNHNSVYSSPIFSPNGRYLTFSSSHTDPQGEIYILELATDTLLNISDAVDVRDFHSVWSPDSLQVAFVSWRDGNGEIYVYNLETGRLSNVTNTPHNAEQYPVWMP